jgi:hypothetical protein
MANGTINLVNNSTALTGVGSKFLTEVTPGDFIYVEVGTVPYTLPVDKVNSDTSITLLRKFTGPTINGMAWTLIPRRAQNSVASALADQVAEAIRLSLNNENNWQKLLTENGNVTITRPDGSSYTGPSWVYLLNTTLKKNGDTMTGSLIVPGVFNGGDYGLRHPVSRHLRFEYQKNDGTWITDGYFYKDGPDATNRRTGVRINCTKPDKVNGNVSNSGEWIFDEDGTFFCPGEIVGAYKGNFSWNNQFNTRAPFYHDFSSAGSSEYHPLIKQRARLSSNEYAFSMGALVSGAGLSWHLHMKGGGEADINHRWGTDGHYICPGQVFPGNYANFDARYQTKGAYMQASDGTIKTSSPIVKLFADGSFETNKESEGATVTRLDVGQYLIKGCEALNSDAAWGGWDGGFDIPTDRNKQPLIWLDYDVNPDGSVLVKTYHRTHPDSPEFARNRIGYKNDAGDFIETVANWDPVDIPSDQFVSVRVEMPQDSIWNQRQKETAEMMDSETSNQESTTGDEVEKG